MIRKEECFPHFELLRFHSDCKILSGSFLSQSFIQEDSRTSKPYLYSGGKNAFSWNSLSFLILRFCLSRLQSSPVYSVETSVLLLALGSIGFLLIAILTACSPYFVGWFGVFLLF